MLRAAKEVQNYKRSEAGADVLFTQLRQPLRAFLCCIRHISSFWSTSLENQFWEMESLDFVCLGQDGTVWSQRVVEANPPPPPPPYPTSDWDSGSKDIGVSILSWKQTSNITLWKQEGIWCPTMWYMSVLCANWEKNMCYICDLIAQYIFQRSLLVWFLFK